MARDLGPDRPADVPTAEVRAASRARRTAAATRSAARVTGQRVRRATTAQGAGQTGLSRVIEMHAFNAAGDALVTVSLAGTLFFAVPSAEARGNVALYLLFTIAPFALLAPVIGPFLDRVRHGRRWAIGTTFAARAFLCWVMAGAVVGEGLWLYPAALLTLVASKAYGISRAAAVPRLLPDGVELVTANSRISLAAIAGASIAAPIGAGLAWIGPQWSLRFAFLVFVVGTIMAIRLPARVDSNVGEEEVSVVPAAAGLGDKRKFRVGPTVVRALRGNAALRAFSGFLTLFLAFVLREESVGPWGIAVALGGLAVGAGVGSTLATSVMSTIKARRPDRLVIACVGGAAVAAGLAALLYGLLTVILVAFAAAFCQQLAKLSLDAVIQRDVPENVRTSAFGRSETLLQLSWVAGGALGIVLPLVPQLGLGIACGWLTLATLLAWRTRGTTAARGPATTSAE